MPPHTNRNMTGGRQRQRQRQRPTKRQRIETIKERKNRKLSFVSEGKQSTQKTKKKRNSTSDDDDSKQAAQSD